MDKINPVVLDLLNKHQIDPQQALWSQTRMDKKTGQQITTWIMLHSYCEIIAVKEGIVFDPPEMIVNNPPTVVILVKGHKGDISEWSFGEASPQNNKNPYPFAMAEKRGKDRVVLKLAGLHGLVYSDIEADEFQNGFETPKVQAPPPPTQPPPQPTNPPAMPTGNAPPPTGVPPSQRPTMNKQNRQFMNMLMDYFKTQQTPQFVFNRQRFCDAVFNCMGRWPASQQDVVLIKQYVTPLEVMLNKGAA